MNDFMSEFDNDPFFNSWAINPASWGVNDRPRITSPRAAKMSCMHLDAYETDSGFHVHCECPGVPKEKIDCAIENNLLTIKINKDTPYVITRYSMFIIIYSKIQG